MGRVADLAAQVNRSSVAQRAALRESLATTIREVALLKLQQKFKSLGRDERDDLAQTITLKVLGAIEAGTTRGKEDGFLDRCCYTTTIDYFRKRNARGVAEPSSATSKRIEPPDAEEQLLRDERAAKIRALLDGAPPNYRRALRAHYLEERSIAEMVEEELGRGELDTSDPAAVQRERERARARVDAWLSRGRMWLRRQLAEQGGERR